MYVSIMKNTQTSNLANERGVVLIEALVSILIFSIGVLGMIGLQARMVQESIHAQYRSDASYLASQAVSQTMVGTLDTNGWEDEIASVLPNGGGTVTTANNELTVVVTWRLPEEPGNHNFTVVSRICPDPTKTNCT